MQTVETLQNTLTMFRYSDIIYMVIEMNINQIIEQKGITKYRLAKESGVPNATLSELCAGKTKIEKCSAETLYRLAKVLKVPMEMLIEDSIKQKDTQTARENRMNMAYPDICSMIWICLRKD